MEKEILQEFNLYEKVIITIHKKIFRKYRNQIRIEIVNRILG